MGLKKFMNRLGRYRSITATSANQSATWPTNMLQNEQWALRSSRTRQSMTQPPLRWATSTSTERWLYVSYSFHNSWRGSVSLLDQSAGNRSSSHHGSDCAGLKDWPNGKQNSGCAGQERPGDWRPRGGFVECKRTCRAIDEARFFQRLEFSDFNRQEKMHHQLKTDLFVSTMVGCCAAQCWNWCCSPKYSEQKEQRDTGEIRRILYGLLIADGTQVRR